MAAGGDAAARFDAAPAELVFMDDHLPNVNAARANCRATIEVFQQAHLPRWLQGGGDACGRRLQLDMKRQSRHSGAGRSASATQATSSV